MSGNRAALAAFVESAPPGELGNVVTAIENLVSDDSTVLESLRSAFEKYNHEQFAVANLPASNQTVIISSFNALGDGRYFDVETQTSFAFDHVTQSISAVQPYELQSTHADLIKSLLRLLSVHVTEHYTSASLGVYPAEGDSSIAVLLVANQYSPNNFWNGRWRSLFLFDPSSGSLRGEIKVDVHYYEDGNVRLLTEKPTQAMLASSATAADISRNITVTEKKYHEELNEAFGNLSEGAFKGLRRQLPVTRQKIAWDKISGYRLGQDIGGGRLR